jgi:chaperone modulatory protein CbpM
MQKFQITLYHKGAQQMTIDELAAAANLHPSLIERFFEFGLIDAINDSPMLFDATAIKRARVAARLRRDLGINLAGIAVILDLLDRLNDLQRQIR